MKKTKRVEKIELEHYGDYRMGLTDLEIKEYLKNRAGVSKMGDLYRRFCRTAGVNTVAVVTCENCKETFTVMYRHDVERFADVMFKGIPTYWD